MANRDEIERVRKQQETRRGQAGNIAANLRWAIDRRGMPLVRLISAAGLRPDLARAYFDGDKVPTLTTLQRIADVLGIGDGVAFGLPHEEFVRMQDHAPASEPQPVQSAPPRPTPPAPVEDPAEIVGTVIAAAGMSEQQFAGHLQHLLADPAGKAYLRVAVLGLRKAL